MFREITWTQFKSLIDNQQIQWQFLSSEDTYELTGYQGPESYLCRIPRNIGVTTELTEFENSYKDNVTEKLTNPSNIESDVSVNIQSSTISKKLRYDQMTQNQSLTQDVYTEVYSYSGTGSFFGCYLSVAKDDVEIKVTIDNEVIVSDLNVSNLPISGNGGVSSVYIWRASASDINFSPPDAMEFSSSVKIELKAHHSSAVQRKMTFGYVVLTKES